MTQRVNREELLKTLESVTPGLASREILEQSTCLAFLDGRIYTFNDEVACSIKSPLKLSGAVQATPLLNLLNKMPEDEVEIEQDEGVLRVKGKRKGSEFRMEKDVLLKVEAVEPPEDWQPIPSEFNDAVSLVHSCASTEESRFVLTCVHITPDCLEATDKLQIARFPLKTGLEDSFLVRAESLKKILGLDVTELSESKSWIHFRNSSGLVLSCRRYLDDYPQLEKHIPTEGIEKVVLPGGLEEIVGRAEIFSNENAAGNKIRVDLRKDRMLVQGEGSIGRYKEMKETKFNGEPIRFLISPKLLVEIAARSGSNECGVVQERLIINTGRFTYVTCTGKIEEKEEKE